MKIETASTVHVAEVAVVGDNTVLFSQHLACSYFTRYLARTRYSQSLNIYYRDQNEVYSGCAASSNISSTKTPAKIFKNPAAKNTIPELAPLSSIVSTITTTSTTEIELKCANGRLAIPSRAGTECFVACRENEGPNLSSGIWRCACLVPPAIGGTSSCRARVSTLHFRQVASVNDFRLQSGIVPRGMLVCGIGPPYSRIWSALILGARPDSN